MNDEFKKLLINIEGNSLELVKYKTLYSNKVKELENFMNSVNSLNDIALKVTEITEYLSDSSQNVMVGVFKGSVKSEIHYENQKIKAIQELIDKKNKVKQDKLL